MCLNNNLTIQGQQKFEGLIKSKKDVNKNTFLIKEESGKLIAELKDRIDNKKYEKLIKKVQEKINELPELLKKMLLKGKSLHSVKIKIKNNKNVKKITIASYLDKKDTIFISENYLKLTENDLGNTIAHEMLHALMDEYGIKGLLNQKGCSRPNNKEIEEYVYGNILTKEGFTDFFKEMNIKIIKIEIKNTLKELGNINKLFKKKQIKLPRIYLSKNDVLKINKLEKNMIKISNNFLKFENTLRTFFGKENFEIYLLNKGIDLNNLDLDAERRFAYTFIEKNIKIYLKEIVKIKKNIVTFSSNFNEFIKIYKKTLNQEFIMRKKINTNNVDYLLNFIDSINSIYGDEFDYYSGNIISGNKYKQNSLLYDFISPEEILARMLDSLISLYTGKVSPNNYPLTKKDLEFLGKFKFEGKEIFGEHIKKYNKIIEKKDVKI